MGLALLVCYIVLGSAGCVPHLELTLVAMCRAQHIFSESFLGALTWGGVSSIGVCFMVIVRTLVMDLCGHTNPLTKPWFGPP